MLHHKLLGSTPPMSRISTELPIEVFYACPLILHVLLIIAFTFGLFKEQSRDEAVVRKPNRVDEK